MAGPPASPMKGIYTTIYAVPDVAAAKAWYAAAFGVDPYFDEPFYVGFDVQGFELGLIPASEKSRPGPGGATAYWGVDDAHAARARLLNLGARPDTGVDDVGGGILVATVLDPWGNVIGVIQNAEFKR